MPDLPAGLRVFTCGHSFHVWAADLLAEMAAAAGIAGHRTVGISAIGGSSVVQHYFVPPEHNLAKQALAAGEVDVLTLSPIWLPDPGIELFARFGLEHNPELRVTVQEYWLPNDEYQPVYPLETFKRKDHDAADLDRLQADHDHYFADMNDHVRRLNASLRRPAIAIVPAGQAALLLRRRIVDGAAPGLTRQWDLFADCWGHASPPLKVLAAYCHFGVIYRRSPEGLPRPALLTENDAWNDDLNRLLQQLAWQAVQAHPLAR